MSAPFTPEQEARIAQLVDDRIVKAAPSLFKVFLERMRLRATKREVV